MKKQQCDEQRNMTKEEWLAEGERLFGKYYEDWKFKCPRCGNVASGQEFKALGITNFINVRTNVLATLKAFNAKLLK